MKDVTPQTGYHVLYPSDLSQGSGKSPSLKLIGTSTNVNSGALTVNFNVNLEEIKDLSDNDFGGGELDICLRKIKYCDESGEEYTMIVVGSQPFREQE